jgi:hypothetical protein
VIVQTVSNRVAQHIPPGARCADMFQTLSKAQAVSLKANGYDGVGRYLENLTPDEVQHILDAGLKLWAIATADHFDGAWMVARAKALGFPAGTTLVMDLESDHDPASAVFAQIDACAASINAGSFTNMLYVGCDQPLTAQQVYQLQNVHLYWRSASKVPCPDCEFTMYQIRGRSNIVVAGVQLDEDWVENDLKGRTPFWCAAA